MGACKLNKGQVNRRKVIQVSVVLTFLCALVPQKRDESRRFETPRGQQAWTLLLPVHSHLRTNKHSSLTSLSRAQALKAECAVVASAVRQSHCTRGTPCSFHYTVGSPRNGEASGQGPRTSARNCCLCFSHQKTNHCVSLYDH